MVLSSRARGFRAVSGSVGRFEWRAKQSYSFGLWVCLDSPLSFRLAERDAGDQ